MKYFENAKVGHKVMCMLRGDGEIKTIDNTWIHIEFDSFGKGKTFSYWKDGTTLLERYTHSVKQDWDRSINQTLFYADDYPLVYYPDWEKSDADKIKAIMYATLYFNDSPMSTEDMVERTFVRPKPRTHTIEIDGKKIEISEESYRNLRDSLGT